MFNSLQARGHFCCLLITFANSLDPDQARQNNVGPDLDLNCFILENPKADDNDQNTCALFFANKIM